MPDSRQLRYFVAVAEELNFSRAAERLHLSQPALSDAIRKLEAELGFPLLRRTSRRVSLTPAGETLLDESREVLARLEEAVRRTHQAARGERGRLRVGFLATGAGELSTRSRAIFSERHADVRVEPRSFDWGGEVPALLSGEADVSFVWLPADTHGLELVEVVSEPRLAALPRDHPLAVRPELSVLDLNPEPIVWTRIAPRAWVDWWAVNPRPDGSEPVWGPTCENVEELLEHVAAGSAIAIVPASMGRFYARPDIAYVTIADVEPLRIAVAWRAGEDSPLVAAFAAVVRELAAPS